MTIMNQSHVFIFEDEIKKDIGGILTRNKLLSFFSTELITSRSKITFKGISHKYKKKIKYQAKKKGIGQKRLFIELNR